MEDRPRTISTTSSTYTASLGSTARGCDRAFLKTFPGLLMITEIVLGLLVWILIASTEYFSVSAFGWVMFVAVFYWVLTVFFLIFYITMVYTKIPQIPWTTVGLSFNASAALLYLLASIVDAISINRADKGTGNYNCWLASTVFAFMVTLCYSGNAYFSFQTWKSRDQGP